jgi:hypothetical protein
VLCFDRVYFDKMEATPSATPSLINYHTFPSLAVEVAPRIHRANGPSWANKGLGAPTSILWGEK